MSPSPNRRKSIAVTHQVNKSRPAHKRRPHSITPGDSVLKQLSPASRARRSIGPRKSILKPRSSIAPEDVDDLTQTMDFTRDIRGSIGENTSRKSLGRRVSFASHAQVRVFEKDPNRGAVPPSPATAHYPGPSQSGTLDNDENNYPGASSMRRRGPSRRSVAFSENGEASMDMDYELESSPLPPGFLAQESFLHDEEQGNVSGTWDEADMDLTTNLALNRPRKSSLGLSSLSHHEDLGVDDHSRSEDPTRDSADSLSGEQGEPTEFTVPLNKSLRMTEPPTAEWLALRAVTHAGGDNPYEPPSDMDEDESFVHGDGVTLGEGDMDLTEAETRLRRMRESLGLTTVPQEDSFTSSDESSIGGGDNQTINLTNVWRDSLGTDSSSVMDLTNIQGASGENSSDEAVNLVLSPVLALQDTPGSSGPHNPNASSSFSKPTLTATLVNVTSSPHDLSASLAPPVFTKPDSVLSEPNNAPPTTSKVKSPTSPRKTGTAAFASPVSPLPPTAPTGADDEDPFHFGSQGNPAKKPTLQLSPSKLTSASVLTGSRLPSSATRRSSTGGLRRPSGYFAQRKSLGPSAILNIPYSISPIISEIDQDPVKCVPESENIEQSPSVQHPKDPMEDVMTGTAVEDPDDPIPLISAETDSALFAEPEPLAMQSTAVFTSIGAAEQWRNHVQPPSVMEEEEGPPISIEQFFNMTSIRFLDELSAPRRSTILPSQLQSAQRRASLQTNDITLADYVVAMAIDAPQLELYSHVAADLQRWIEHSREIYRQAEEEAAKVTPMLFREYSTADEQTRTELLQQLKLIKANNHAAARSQWYDWRLQWVEQLYAIANQGFAELEQDARTVESIIQQAQNILPLLREEHAQVTREFEQEQSIAAEIENCDQGYLNELKATLAEQGVALDEFRAEVSEAKAKLERLEEKLRDLETEKVEIMASIESSQRTLHIQKSSTRAEAFRLKDELASLEELHLWRTTRVHADLFELVYASRFHVHIPCAMFKPLKDQIRIAKTKEMLLRAKDQFPRLTDLTIKVAQQRLASSPSHLGIRQIIQGLGDFWSGCAQLRTHFSFLSIKYPVSVYPQLSGVDGDLDGLIVTATILLPSSKAKLYVSFVLDTDTLWAWPTSIRNVGCKIKKAYGPDIDTISIENIRTTILQRMAKSTPDDNHACFLDACIEATLEYELVE
ncbi:Spc7 kinetochore protein-domain-containing protein [Multifurca ochricompacta]|uniref:Spc7 kinetochore protein-domain-containing protein n=1 Tax=Multifurca ochricompacta TaxID=376703 RepID=A0AAD4MD85_9AGAM|nr:Spc7 kinetochore protein-domain-containing protein [Multifurca ochricompacta]